MVLRDSDSTPVKVKVSSLMQDALAPSGRYWQKSSGSDSKWQLETYDEFFQLGIRVPTVAVVEVHGQVVTLLWPSKEAGVLVTNRIHETQRLFEFVFFFLLQTLIVFILW